MILGMSMATFVLVHVVISLIAIVAGLVVMFGMLGSNRQPGLTAIFLLFTILTSATGFLFPFTKLLPSHVVGIISVVLLAIATFALYGGRLVGIWRPVFTVTATLSLYLNVFVLVVQSFLKIPLLNGWAPTQTEPAFLVAQGATLLVFLGLTILATLKFRPARLAAH